MIYSKIINHALHMVTHNLQLRNLGVKSKKWLVLLLGLVFMGFSSLANTKSVLFLASSNVPAGKFQVLSQIAKSYGLDTTSIYLEQIPEGVDETFFNDYDAVVIDTFMGEAMRARLAGVLPGAKLPVAWVWDKQPEALNMPLALVKRLADYYSNGGQDNFDNFFAVLAAWLNNESYEAIPAPVIFPESAIYHPDAPNQLFASIIDYLEWKGLSTSQINSSSEHPPLIAVAFHEQAFSSMQTKLIDTFIHCIEEKGAIPVAYYYPVMVAEPANKLLKNGDQILAEVIISTRIILDPNKPRKEYEPLGIPVIQATPYRKGNEEMWRGDEHGLQISDVPFYMSQAEYAGVIDIQVASAMDDIEQQLLPIDEQLESQINKALNLVALQRKANKDKNLTLFFWNYPAGEKNLSASFLNVPESLVSTIKALKSNGYEVNAPDAEKLLLDLQRLLEAYYRDNKLEDLLADGLADKLPLDTYNAWLQSLPASVQTELQKQWGGPEESDMVIRQDGVSYFVIPRLLLGKMAVLPQPPRADRSAGEDKEKQLYHSTSAIPSHFYMATYLWVRTVQNSDAIIHFGTHGSQEWLPGKERGLSVKEDYPMLLLGDVPVVYPYIADNIGEALHARRRGRAVIISHQTPAFRPAGMHDELTEMHNLVHQWFNQDEGAVREEIRKDILARVTNTNIDSDMGWTADSAENEFARFLDELHVYLHDLAQTAQPLGLHALGRAPIEEHRLSTVLMMLGTPFWEEAAKYSGAADTDLDEALAIDYENLTASGPYTLLKQALINAELPGDINNNLKAQLEQARQWYADIGAANELPSLINALAGKYIPTSYGGDPIKSPDAYPTGRNMYGFDPSRVPTRQSWEAGKKAADELMAVHKEQTGEHLKKTTFSLWSVETMRHQGLLEAQALWLMGVEPVWDRGGRVIDVKLIDRSVLNRPRVDVVLSTTGLYRDHFPNAMRQLARAVQLAAQDESDLDNIIAANTKRIQQQLQASGVSVKDARTAAETRIFSSASGHYSTGLDDAAMATDTWDGKEEGDEKLAKLYLSKMQYAYGPDEATWGQKTVAGAKGDINLYAEQLRGTEAAVLSRSSNTYGMLTTDDPFQYLGGIGLAVRSLDGDSPQLYISNLRSGGAGKLEGAAKFLSKELATRQFHPGYIKGLMAEGYAGTLEVLNATNNLWGWTAVATEIVRDDQWEQMVDVYVRDKYNLGLDEWFEENNPHALAQTIERMIEAQRSGYWDAQPDTIDLLKARYQELATKYDVRSDNSRFLQYVADGAVKDTDFAHQDDAAIQKQPQIPNQEITESAGEQVAGLKLEQQDSAVIDDATDWVRLALVLLILVFFLGGALRQARANKHY